MGVAACLVLQRGLEPRRACRCASGFAAPSASLKKRFAFWCPWVRVSPNMKQAAAPGGGGCLFGAPAGTRTPDTLLKRQVLYLLSYWGRWRIWIRILLQIKTTSLGFDLEKEEGTYGYAVFAEGGNAME